MRALDTLTPVGAGQRIGIFAGSGVGKSTLLVDDRPRHRRADLGVVALVGERGREVREFLEHDLGPEGLARSVVVVATSDEPAAASGCAPRSPPPGSPSGSATSGGDVLLLMDCRHPRRAWRSARSASSAGEPPATRGYPPSVFALLPRLLERAGPGATGSITGLYTVLVEGDDHATTRSPTPPGRSSTATSCSTARLATGRALPEHRRARVGLPGRRRDHHAPSSARRHRPAPLLAACRDVRGPRRDRRLRAPAPTRVVDRAIALRGEIDAFLRQAPDDVADPEATWARLTAIVPADLVAELTAEASAAGGAA